MDVKTYLNLAERYDRQIEYKLNELYRYKMLMTSISATANDDVRVQHSTTGGKLENSVIKVVELEAEINSLVDEMVDKKRAIVRQIESLTDTRQYSVLIERYIERKPFDDIANSLGYSRKQINRIHGEALSEFERQFGDEISKLS